MSEDRARGREVDPAERGDRDVRRAGRRRAPRGSSAVERRHERRRALHVERVEREIEEDERVAAVERDEVAPLHAGALALADGLEPLERVPPEPERILQQVLLQDDRLGRAEPLLELGHALADLRLASRGSVSARAENNTYDLKSVKLPRLAGKSLKAFVRLLDSRLSPLLIPKLMKDAGITALREQVIDEPPTYYPFRSFEGSTANDKAKLPEIEDGVKPEGFRFASSADYVNAYKEGKITPVEVAERVIRAIEESNSAAPPLRAIIACYRDDVLKQAHESTERYREGKPLGPFDGVPVGVKDEVDMVPYPTTVGTKFHRQPSRKRGRNRCCKNACSRCHAYRKG